MKFVRQTFPSRLVAGMNVAVMSRQKNKTKKKTFEIAKLKVENKHEVKLSVYAFGGRMRVTC